MYFQNCMLNIFVSFKYEKCVVSLLEDKQNVKFGGI